MIGKKDFTLTISQHFFLDCHEIFHPERETVEGRQAYNDGLNLDSIYTHSELVEGLQFSRLPMTIVVP